MQRNKNRLVPITKYKYKYYVPIYLIKFLFLKKEKLI